MSATIAAAYNGQRTSLSLPLTLIPGAIYGIDGSKTEWPNSTPFPSDTTLALSSNQVVFDQLGLRTIGQIQTINGVATTIGVLQETTLPSTSTATPTSSVDSSTSSPALVPSSRENSTVTTTESASGTLVTATLLPGNKILRWIDPFKSGKIWFVPAEPEKARLKGGAAAGIAVGCLVAGALVATLACFLLFSRRKKRAAAQAGHLEPTVYSEEHDLKHPAKTSSTPMGAIDAAAIIENNLPQPKEDNAIIGDLSRIKSRIEGHVDSYYHTAGANNQATAQALSAALGTAFPVSMLKLQELLSNPRKRPAVLRTAIAWIIVSRIDFSSGPDTTFLPAYVAGATRDLCASGMDEPSEFSEFRAKEFQLIPSAHVAFLSKWRQITAALSGNTFTKEIAADDNRLVNINSALDLADTFLRPCAKGGDDDKRLVNLEEIMKRAARFGFLLFSQPSSFHFDWTDDGSGLVVFPGLLQVSDDNGRPVASPRKFGSKEVIPI